MRIRVSIRQRGKERKGKARPAMAKQAKQDRQADGSSTVVYMHALWLKLCGPSSRMCVCVCVCVCSSAVLLFVRPITLRSCENRPNSTTIIHGSGPITYLRIYILTVAEQKKGVRSRWDKVSSSSPAGVSAFTCRGASDVVSLGLKNSCADGARCSVARCELFDCCLRRATT